MTQQEVIKAFMHSLDETEMSGRAALKKFPTACSLPTATRLIPKAAPSR